MAKSRKHTGSGQRQSHSHSVERADMPGKVNEPTASLKDRLSPDVIERLKAEAARLKQEEEERKVLRRQEEEDARKAEEKRRENDFAYLLERSRQDWRKYK